jgi:hypothetical protein
MPPLRRIGAIDPRAALPRLLRLATGVTSARPAPVVEIRRHDQATAPVPRLTSPRQPAPHLRPGERGTTDPRRATPREIAQLAMDLYLDGTLGFEDSAMLGFQPDLNRRFGATIGALTGQPAAPDSPRDYIALWEARLAFERRFNPAAAAVQQRMARILATLSQIAGRPAGSPSAAE